MAVIANSEQCLMQKPYCCGLSIHLPT